MSTKTETRLLSITSTNTTFGSVLVLLEYEYIHRLKNNTEKNLRPERNLNVCAGFLGIFSVYEEHFRIV